VLSARVLLLLIQPNRSVNRTESENEMLDLTELITHLEVQTNILNEKRAEKVRYEQGVRDMQLATTVEPA
jgi:hypothetical protein